MGRNMIMILPLAILVIIVAVLGIYLLLRK